MVRRGIYGLLSLFIDIEGPLECICIGGRDKMLAGLGVVFASMVSSSDFASGKAIALLDIELELSEAGGDGGVGVSDTIDEADFVGGVAIVGEEFDVAGDVCERADCGLARSGIIGDGFLLC